MKVKICGLMDEDHIRICAETGADACGFVVEYPEAVPWNIDAGKASALAKQVPAGIDTFMVTGGFPAKVENLAQKVKPKFVQLHHKETLAEIVETSKRLKELGISTIKTLRLNEQGEPDFEIRDIAKAAKALEKAGLDALLIDSFTQSRPGGSGRTVDIKAYLTLRKNTTLPVILAGGLTADNLAALVPPACPPHMLDVLSGVESSPGIKDKDKIDSFIRAARSLQQEKPT